MVRSVISSKGPSSDGAPETNATTLPVTASTNATSEDLSSAASGKAPQVPQIIETMTAALLALAQIMASPSKSAAHDPDRLPGAFLIVCCDDPFVLSLII